MNYLAIDTSSEYLTVALSFEGRRFSSYSENAGLRHSVRLMPEVDSVLKQAGIGVSDLDFFAVNIGAGSFTGIRIGVATVKAFAKSTGKKVLPVTAFDLMAYNESDGKLLTVIDARHGYYYVAGYADGVLDVQPQYLSEAETLALCAGRKVLSFTEIPSLPVKVVSPLEGLWNAVEKKSSEAALPQDVHPLYVRKSQAEEHR